MNTDHLYEFLVLSKTLNYSQAAKALYISQSILTRHVQEMERELDTILLHRSTHGVALTEAGKILASQAPHIIGQCDDTLQLLQIKNLPVKGSIRIYCELEMSYASFLHTFIHDFMERYKDIDVLFEVKPENTPPDMIFDCDFLFTPCLFHNLPPMIHREMVHSHGTYVLLPPGHAFMSKSLLSLHHLADETLIVPYADELFGPYMQNWLLAEKQTRGRLSCMKVKNLSTALFWVTSGKGIAIVPRHVRNMVSPDTFMVSISDPNCRFNEYLYYNARPNNGAAKLFFEEFRNTYIHPQTK